MRHLIRLLLCSAVGLVSCGTMTLHTGDDVGTCESPVFISTGGTYTGDTSNAAQTRRCTCASEAPGREGVFVIDLGDLTRVELSTDGSSFDTVLYVRRGSCGGGDEVACNDDGGSGVNSHLSLDLEAGTYYIFVDAYSQNEGGEFVLEVDMYTY